MEDGLGIPLIAIRKAVTLRSVLSPAEGSTHPTALPEQAII